MEMEMTVQEESSVSALPVDQLIERLGAAADLLEQAAERIAGRVSLEARGNSREAELEKSLAEANATIASLKAGRKTLPAGVATLLAKEGPGASGTVEVAALDAAMSSLSLEQRIAVKAQLMRAGMIG
jgi:hypothetical protein